MLNSMDKLIRCCIRDRRARGLSQAEAARLAGCHPSYLARVETGRRPLSRRMAARLETAYGKRPGSYTRKAGFPRRGRKRLEPQTQRALQEIRQSVDVEFQKVRYPFPSDGLRPKHPASEETGRIENPFWPMAVHLGKQAADEVTTLESRRGDDEEFWRLATRQRFDSWSEKRLFVKFGLADGRMAQVSPHRMGCAARIAHRSTGKNLGRHAVSAMVLTVDDVHIVCWPQRTVRTPAYHPRPDHLIVASHRGRRVTAVVEVEGDRWHADPQAELLRDCELDLPVLHLSADDVKHPGIVQRIAAWLRDLCECEVTAGAET